MNSLIFDLDENIVRIHLGRIVSDQNQVRFVIPVGRGQYTAHLQKVTFD